MKSSACGCKSWAVSWWQLSHFAAVWGAPATICLRARADARAHVWQGTVVLGKAFQSHLVVDVPPMRAIVRATDERRRLHDPDAPGRRRRSRSRRRSTGPRSRSRSHGRSVSAERKGSHGRRRGLMHIPTSLGGGSTRGVAPLQLASASAVGAAQAPSFSLTPVLSGPAASAPHPDPACFWLRRLRATQTSNCRTPACLISGPTSPLSASWCCMGVYYALRPPVEPQHAFTFGPAPYVNESSWGCDAV